MRPILVETLLRHGLPGWLAPDYVILVALSVTVGAAITLRQVRRDGSDLTVTARALALAYLAALVGGYVLEALRHVPEALAAGSLRPIARSGRAAYGGLLAGILVAALYLRRRRQPLGPFFDQVTAGTGLVFAAVRTGCFLAGCDYGAPTASALGVRFPPGSLAALDHHARGWVPAGAASLPVHPTELYEAALGIVAVLIALGIARARGHGKARGDGSVFLAWLAAYAIGRFMIEFVRGDVDRGLALGLSTAQYLSIGIVVVLIGIIARRTLLARRNAPAPVSVQRRQLV